jgi:hypothetical protein
VADAFSSPIPFAIVPSDEKLNSGLAPKAGGPRVGASIRETSAASGGIDGPAHHSPSVMCSKAPAVDLSLLTQNRKGAACVVASELAASLAKLILPFLFPSKRTSKSLTVCSALPLHPLEFVATSLAVIADYSTIGLSLKQHPVSFARPALSRGKIVTAADVQDADRFPNGRPVRVAGLVLVRQRPGTASGVVFITLEDETGVVNLIIWATTYERYRRFIRYATLLQANGIIQREGKVIHVLSHVLIDRTSLLQGLSQPSRDFH